MTKTEHLNNQIPDLSWLIKLSEEDYGKLKKRYADFIGFTFRCLIKEAVKMEMLQEDDKFSKEILKELVADGTLPKSALKELLD